MKETKISNRHVSMSPVFRGMCQCHQCSEETMSPVFRGMCQCHQCSEETMSPVFRSMCQCHQCSEACVNVTSVQMKQCHQCSEACVNITSVQRHVSISPVFRGMCQCHQCSEETMSPKDNNLPKSRSINGCLYYFVLKKRICKETKLTSCFYVQWSCKGIGHHWGMMSGPVKV
jgi:hypothetical protein